MKLPFKIILSPSSDHDAPIILQYHDRLIRRTNSTSEFEKNLLSKGYHLYVVIDKEIRSGDWYLIKQYGNELLRSSKPATDDDIVHQNKFECYRIIASTDKCIRLPLIPIDFIDEYIDAYNKNDIISYVKLNTIYRDEPNCSLDDVRSKICIKTRLDNTVLISKHDRKKEVLSSIRTFFMGGKYDWEDELPVIPMEISQFGITKVNIKERTDHIDVDITLVRPGIFIGRRGETINKLSSYMKDKLEKEIKFNIIEETELNHLF